MLTEKSLDLLKRSGWSDTYRYDVSDYSRLYNLAGCHPPDCVLNFLSRFGGLYIVNISRLNRYAASSFKFGAAGRVRNRPLHFLCSDYDEAFASAGLPKVTAYPIGSSHGGHIELVMVEAGSVYGSYDPYFWLVGDSGEEALENLCTGKELRKLFPLDE